MSRSQKVIRVPVAVIDERKRMAQAIGVSLPKAFTIFDNIMAEYVKSKRVKGRKTKIELTLEEK